MVQKQSLTFALSTALKGLFILPFRDRYHVNQRKKGEKKMNREFLRSLELEEEQIDKIMKEHGKTLQAEREVASTQQSDEVTSLKSDIEELQNKLETERAHLQEKTNELALLNSGVDRDYLPLLASHLKNVDSDKVDEKINQLKEQYGRLFYVQDKEEPKESESEPVKEEDFVIKDTKLTQPQAKSWTVKDIMAIKDDKERQQLIAENGELFI